ncbi:MAG: type II secretion system minor pseudopilin GspI [Gammaproteobacteria bacterium]|nr:type II secretion system minor pseudopilin GspI [Gammaproteobacteria bacterium]
MKQVNLRRFSGFTLLEILVALSIVAVGLVAVAKGLVGNVTMTQEVEDRLVANWVASNRLAEIRLERKWRSGSQAQNTVTMAGRTWYMKEQFTTTPDKDLARVDVSVFSDKNTERQSASLFGYITRHKKPKAGGESQDNNGENQNNDNDETGPVEGGEVIN